MTSDRNLKRNCILDMHQAGATQDRISKMLGHASPKFVGTVIRDARKSGDPRAVPVRGLRRRSHPVPFDIVAQMRAARASRARLKVIAYDFGVDISTVHRHTYGFHPDHSPSRSQAAKQSQRVKTDRDHHTEVLLKCAPESTRGFESVQKFPVEKSTGFAESSNV